MSKLQEELIGLARARLVCANLKITCDDARRAYLETIEYAVWDRLNTLHRETKAILPAAEVGVRELAVEAFDGESRFPAEGVEIKQYSVIEWNKAGDDLETWAWEHQPGAFVLDVKRLGAAVKAGLVPASVARIVKEPRASIKRDLGFLLEVASE